MKFVVLLPFLFLLMASDAFGYSPLNKTPKIGATGACDECQNIVKRIVAVAKDPTKVAELKILLSALCHETSYEQECRLFVSKIDLFLERLLPYLADAHHVCQEIHICGNRRLELFHRVGMLFARKHARREQGVKDLICEECQLAAHELSMEVNDPQFQQNVRDWLGANVCTYFSKYKETCNEFLDEVLPEFWQELHDILSDQRKFCQQLELCPPTLNSYGNAKKTGSVRILLGIVEFGGEKDEEDNGF